MIQFTYDWSDFLNQLIFVLAVAVLPLQLWLLVFRHSTGFSRRQVLRLGLNLLLWVAVMAFILQPYLKREASFTTGIIFGTDVHATFSKSLTDSLKTAKILNLPRFEDIESLASLDTILLAGQDFDPSVFPVLLRSEHHPAIKFISYFQPDRLQKLSWKGVLKKGEIQTLSGNIASSGKQVLKIQYGSQTLDSVKLDSGNQVFKLKFPVFTQGRTSAELSLAGKTIDTIRFFARPSETLAFQFKLDNPDFESRNLASWLGRNGHSVLYTAMLSKNVQSKLTINNAKDPDVVITEPGNAYDALVKKTVAHGKSVLFINLTDPSSEIAAVNGAFGTKFQIKKISNEETITISPELTALPFQFVNSNHNISVSGYPAAVEKIKGNVGVSLLNETFPLMLTGDSISYQKVWNTIIAAIRPATKSNIEIQAPVYKDLNTTVFVNNFDSMPQFMKIGNDTLFFTSSPINSRSATGSFRPVQSGWLTLSDSLESEMYVQSLDATSNLARTEDFVRSYNAYQKELGEASIDTAMDRGIKKQLSSWSWFTIVMICLVVVWIEGKL